MNRTGRKVRHRADPDPARAAGHRIGSLLINPGGPGASGFECAVYLSFGPAFGGLSNRVMQRFDLIGFDPRGWGAPARWSASQQR